MSFLSENTYTNEKEKTIQRKEYGSFLAHQKYHISQNLVERTSSFTSKGSMTIEAALAVPFFFFGVICLVCLLEIICIQTTMKSALREVGREMAKEAYLNPMIFPDKMEREIAEIIGEERLEHSIVAGGSKGLDCKKSRIFHGTSIMELSVRYKMKIPVLMFRIPMIEREETIRVKGWTGYAEGGFGNHGEDMVYITDTGIVYHKDKNCTYLDLSVRMVDKDDIAHLRNAGGGKYYPCERCSWTKQKNVYITNTGTRYHNSVTCSGLKRGVYAVPISEVYGRGGCSRCVK